jgi:hypothetical protein
MLEAAERFDCPWKLDGLRTDCHGIIVELMSEAPVNTWYIFAAKLAIKSGVTAVSEFLVSEFLMSEFFLVSEFFPAELAEDVVDRSLI